MKKLLLAISFGIAGLVSSLAIADPSTTMLEFTCPTPSGGDIHTLSNFGGRVAGYGFETVAGNPSVNFPYFWSFIPGGSSVPAKISSGDYVSSATDFDSTNGMVSCTYTSGAGFSDITVRYQLTNGQGGIITAQTPNTIQIAQFVGLKS